MKSELIILRQHFDGFYRQTKLVKRDDGPVYLDRVYRIHSNENDWYFHSFSLLDVRSNQFYHYFVDKQGNFLSILTPESASMMCLLIFSYIVVAIVVDDI